MNADELRNLLALHLVPGLGPRLTKALLERFGSAGAVLRASPQQLAETPHIGSKLSEDLHRAMKSLNIAKEEELMAKHGVRLLALGTADYPASLAVIADPPHLLYVRGGLEERDGNAVAIVGSRHCTAYGRRNAERLGADLVKKGFTIVSGLARGIDGSAHRGALQAGGRTIAVLAGGLAKIYPPEHTDLAAEVEANGSLVSESAMSMEPMAGMFPARNRLISGLSRAVIVVEAAERSGALITARHAAEQGREVFAVPGPVDSAASGGTLQLLRSGAKLVRHAEDVVEDLDGVAPIIASRSEAAPLVKGPPPGLDDQQRRIWDFLDQEPQHFDDLARHLQLPVSELSRIVMMLEMKRVLRRLPGNRYERFA